MDWEEPSAAMLAPLAEAIHAVMADPSAGINAKKLATQLREQMSPFVKKAPGLATAKARLEAAYVAMSKDSLARTANVLVAIHKGAATSATSKPSAATPHQAALAAPKQPPAPKPARKTHADKSAERLASRATLIAAQEKANAARKRAGRAGRTAASASDPAQEDAAAASAGAEQATVAGGNGFFQRLTTGVAVMRAGREGREAEAALPEVERKLGKRASEVDRLQSGLSRSARAAARDAEAEAELDALQNGLPARVR